MATSSSRKSPTRRSPLRKSSSTKKARVLSSKEAYRGPVFWVTTDQVLEPTGVRVRRDVVRHSGSVVILAVDESMDFQPIAFTLKILSSGEQRRFQDDFIGAKKLAFVPRGDNNRLSGILNRLAVAGTVGKPSFFQSRIPQYSTVL